MTITTTTMNPNLTKTKVTERKVGLVGTYIK